MTRGLTHESSHTGSVEWYTPPHIFERLGLTFDLDPCHPEGDRLPWVPAARVYTRQDDGLAQPWEGRVWLNPPYGAELPKWLAKMAEHRHGVALIFARTPSWFHDHVATADAVLFLRDRVAFVDRTGAPPVREDGKRADSPGSGSMLVAWGWDCATALLEMQRAGHGTLMTFVR